MNISNRTRLGGVLLIAAGGFFGRELLAWAFNKMLDAGLAGWRSGWLLVVENWQVALGVVLMLCGSVLLFWPKKKPLPTPKENPASLVKSSLNVVSQIRRHRDTRYYSRSHLPPITDLTSIGDAVLLSFNKRGFTVPHFADRFAECAAVGMESYFALLIPLLRQGHYDEARDISASASEHAESVAEQFDPSNWFLSPY